MDPTILRYIRNSSDDRRVRDELSRMYENHHSEGTPMIDDGMVRRMGDRGHAEEVSRAMQRLETMAGNGGNFRMQGVFDMAQQEYDGEAARQHRTFTSGDRDGFQDYQAGATEDLAMAQRAAVHAPIDRVNAAQQQQYVQQRLRQHVGNAGTLYNWLNLTR